jgi:hypothetical protein
MGVRVNPCFACPLRTGCEHRNELRAKALGIGAVSVNFRCERLAKELRPGRRVMVPAISVVEGRYYDEERKSSIAVPATITGAVKGYQFVCVIDPGALPEHIDGRDMELYRFRKPMRHTRIIRFLDEPDAQVCKNGRVMRGETCDRGPDNERGTLSPCWCKDGYFAFEDAGTVWEA